MFFLRTLLIWILWLATFQQIPLFSLNILGFHQKYIFTSNREAKSKLKYHDYIQISAGCYHFSQLLSLTTSAVNYLISHLPLVRFPPLNIIQFLNNRSKFIRLSDYLLPWKVRLDVIARENEREVTRAACMHLTMLVCGEKISTVKADNSCVVKLFL